MYHLPSDLSHHPFVKVRTTGGLMGAFKDEPLSKRHHLSPRTAAQSQKLSSTFTWKMSSIRAACFLCAALFAMVRGFTHEDMKDALLKTLGLSEVPKIHKRDLENLVIPTHIKNKYISMLKLHHARRRRSLPSLAGILRGIPGNAGKINMQTESAHDMKLNRPTTI